MSDYTCLSCGRVSNIDWEYKSSPPCIVCGKFMREGVWKLRRVAVIEDITPQNVHVPRRLNWTKEYPDYPKEGFDQSIKSHKEWRRVK